MKIDIVLSFQDGKPIYRQIEEAIASQILSGKLKGGEILPSTRELSLGLDVSVIAPKMAYENLQRKGYLYAIPGKGTFVSALSEEEKERLRLEVVDAILERELPVLERFGISPEEFAKRILKK